MAETSILAGTLGLTPLFHGLLAPGQWREQRASNLLDGAPPFYRCYRTADGGHVAVGAIEGRFYRELLALTGLAGRIDPQQQHDRSTWPATAELLASAFAGKARDEWAAAAEESDACVAPVLTWREAAQHAHNRANGWFADGELGPQRVLSFEMEDR